VGVVLPDPVTVELPVTGPIAADELLAFLARRAVPGVEVVSGRTYFRTLRIGSEVGTVAVRLLEKCQAVLRVGGPSAGADEMVRIGRELGLKIYQSLDEIPELK